MSQTTFGPGDRMFEPGRLELLERKRILDGAWIGLFCLVLASVLVPWLFRALEVDATAVAWTVLAYSALFVALSAWLETGKSIRRLRWSLYGLQILNVLFLDALWIQVGGVQLTSFLLVFVLPIVISGLVLTRWEPYALSGLTSTVVILTALGASPALRWYADRSGLPGLRWAGERVEPWVMPETLVGVEPDPAQLAVTLFFFVLILFAASVATSSLAVQLVRLRERLEVSRRERSEAEALAEKVLTAAKDPSCLVDRESHRITLASDSFVRQLLVDRRDLTERTFFELVDFSFPDVVEEILCGGEAPFVVYRVGEDVRIARVTVASIDHRGSRYAHVTLQDVTDVSHLKLALDVIDALYILMDTRGRVLYFNQPSLKRFARLYPQAEATQALGRDDLPNGWWDPGARRWVQRDLELDGVHHAVEVVTADIPGEHGRIALLTLRPESEDP